jgi:hypothetical protein
MGPDEVLVDTRRVGTALVYRGVRVNDTFRPFGERRKMRLAAFLKRQGLPRDKRHAMWVVATLDGEVVWVPGVRAAEACRVSAESPQVLHLRRARSQPL